jgi:hypothetical protein
VSDSPNKSIRIAFLAAVAIFALVTAVTFFLIGGTAEDDDPTPDDALAWDSTHTVRAGQNAYAAADQEGALGLEMIEYALDPASGVVEGSVQNTAEDPYVNVQVGFELQDASGSSVGMVRDTVPEIAPGGSWLFRIAVTQANASSASLVDLTGGRRDATGRMVDPYVTPSEDGYYRSADPTPSNDVRPR